MTRCSNADGETINSHRILWALMQWHGECAFLSSPHSPRPPCSPHPCSPCSSLLISTRPLPFSLHTKHLSPLSPSDSSCHTMPCSFPPLLAFVFLVFPRLLLLPHHHLRCSFSPEFSSSAFMFSFSSVPFAKSRLYCLSRLSSHIPLQGTSSHPAPQCSLVAPPSSNFFNPSSNSATRCNSYPSLASPRRQSPSLPFPSPPQNVSCLHPSIMPCLHFPSSTSFAHMHRTHPIVQSRLLLFALLVLVF